MLMPSPALHCFGHSEHSSAIPTCTPETCRLSVVTVARISSRRLTMYCPWGLLLAGAAQSSIRFRRLHCLLRSMEELGARRCVWLKCSLSWSAIAMVSPAASRHALRRYAGTLTRLHPASPAWGDIPPCLKPAHLKRAGMSAIEEPGSADIERSDALLESGHSSLIEPSPFFSSLKALPPPLAKPALRRFTVE